MAISFKIRQLKTFIALMNYKTTIKAGEILGLSQPAVSCAITQFEQKLGMALFERNGHNLKPNKAAYILEKRLKLGFAQIENAENEILSRHPNAKPIAILSKISEIHLRAFYSFFQHRQITIASEIAGLKQPNLTRALNELSSIIGFDLYKRDGNRFNFTKDGEIIARKIGLFYKEIEFALSEIDANNGLITGSINIGALPLARSKWLPEIIVKIANEYPQIDIKIIDGSYNELLEALLNGGIDYIFGAIRDKNPHNSLEQSVLFSDPLVIVMRSNHKYAQNFNSNTDKLTNEQLANIRWILPRKNTPARMQFEKFLATKNIPPPKYSIECSSLVATRAMLLNSDFAALLSSRQILPELENDQLKIMGPPLTSTNRDIGITIRSGFLPSPLHKEFIKTALACANNI